MSEDPLAVAAAHAAKQYGLMTHAQITEAGLSRTVLSRLVQRGVWQVVRPRIFRKAAASQSEGQLQLATCLWLGEGTVVSHRSAAKLWGLDLAAENLEVTTPSRSGCGEKGLVVHRATLLAEDMRVRRGIPVTSGVRTVIDLASCLDEEPLAWVVEEAWRRQLAAPAWVQKRLRQLKGRGRRGALALARVLADCRRRSRPLESALEVRLWRLLRKSRLPLPLAGYEFQDDEGQPGRIDFAWPSRELALEADGFSTHGDRETFERDRVRTSRLAALGWRVLTVTWRQLDEDAPRVIARIRRALEFLSERPAGPVAPRTKKTP